jgi:hypothetical protein
MTGIHKRLAIAALSAVLLCAPSTALASRPTQQAPQADCTDAAQIAHAYPVASGTSLIDFLTGVMLILRGSGSNIQIDGWTYARDAGGCNVVFTYSENGRQVRLRYFVDGMTGEVRPLDEVTRQTNGM